MRTYQRCFFHVYFMIWNFGYLNHISFSPSFSIKAYQYIFQNRLNKLRKLIPHGFISAEIGIKPCFHKWDTPFLRLPSHLWGAFLLHFGSENVLSLHSNLWDHVVLKVRLWPVNAETRNAEFHCYMCRHRWCRYTTDIFL